MFFQIFLNFEKVTPLRDKITSADLLTPSFAILIPNFCASFGEILSVFKILPNSLILFTFLVNLELLSSSHFHVLYNLLLMGSFDFLLMFSLDVLFDDVLFSLHRIP